jgi:aspartyl-tRNA(Asn)/glutamyl-tRNA(Gln) amidotransferase subunit C
MSLHDDDVLKIAHLARLHVADGDVPRHARELGNILALVEQMNQVNTDHVRPMAHPLDQTQRLRADVVTEVDERTRYQACAPSVRDGLYLVPRVIE